MPEVYWPTIGDYSLAIQHPHICFSQHPNLKAGHVLSTDAFGLPIGASGNFAVVYEFETAQGILAVRCFTSRINNSGERYEKLHNRLNTVDLPMFVSFKYIRDCMLVRRERYPVLIMNWVPGQQLHSYIEANLHNSVRLDQLAKQWHTTFSKIYAQGIAHGDLQHGNILLDGCGSIRVIDYDGMYTADLASTPPGEFGHRNYQHPERVKQRYYAADTDIFSFLVIYLSLLALRSYPQLWKDYHTGENLLFQEQDFRQPGITPIWKQLSRTSDETVTRLTALLTRFCQRPINELAYEFNQIGLTQPVIEITPNDVVWPRKEAPKLTWYDHAYEFERKQSKPAEPLAPRVKQPDVRPLPEGRLSARKPKPVVGPPPPPPLAPPTPTETQRSTAPIVVAIVVMVVVLAVILLSAGGIIL